MKLKFFGGESESRFSIVMPVIGSGKGFVVMPVIGSGKGFVVMPVIGSGKGFVVMPVIGSGKGFVPDVWWLQTIIWPYPCWSACI